MCFIISNPPKAGGLLAILAFQPKMIFKLFLIFPRSIFEFYVQVHQFSDNILVTRGAQPQHDSLKKS